MIMFDFEQSIKHKKKQHPRKKKRCGQFVEKDAIIIANDIYYICSSNQTRLAQVICSHVPYIRF